MSIVALLTDFGLRDHYVACMKGVIARIAPDVTIIDISHDIPTHDVVHAAFVLDQVWEWFPPETAYIGVVDPGVGTARRILAARYSGRYVVAPDNGLVSLVHHHTRIEEVRVVENNRLLAGPITSTFHGRDIMAPVAAHLARGVRLSEVGPTTDHLEVLQLPEPTREPDGSLRGQVLHVDHFGNLISNVARAHLAATSTRRGVLHVFLADRCIGPLRNTYAEASPREPLALIGSTGMLEIAVNQGSAAQVLGAGAGASVALRWSDQAQG